MLGVGLGQIANVLAKFDSRNLQVDPTQCSRLRHMKATCTRCMDYCPRHAISFGESISIDADKCNDCGICTNVCPTGALEATGPSNAELLNRIEHAKETAVLAFACPKAFKGSDERVLAVNCIGRLDESILVGAIAQGIGKVVLVDGPCQDCPGAVGRKAAAQAVAESNALAQAFGLSSRISFVSEVPFQRAAKDEAAASSEALSRRAFLTSFFRESQAAAALTVSTVLEKELEKKPQRINGELPQRLSTKRQLLLEMLPRLGRLASPDFEMENGSWATCRIKESCTACQMCAFFCPTGALSKIQEDSKPALAFRVSHCTNCRLCAEVCYWKSLELLPRVNLGVALEDGKETVTFDAETIALLSPEEKSKRLMKSLFGI
jgi:Pyruvate/2-oxoacid:ferredoxin oxidoreductase delta subunit/coenzyme F420-reducing hydrogenase delta subunit